MHSYSCKLARQNIVGSKMNIGFKNLIFCFVFILILTQILLIHAFPDLSVHSLIINTLSYYVVDLKHFYRTIFLAWYKTTELFNEMWLRDAIFDVTTQITVSLSSGNVLLSDNTQPLPEPVLAYHRMDSVVLTWGHFQRNCSGKVPWKPGGRLNTNASSCQYRHSHYTYIYT